MWEVGPPRFGRRAFGFIANNPHPSPPQGEGVDLRRLSQGAALGTCYGSVAVGGFTASRWPQACFVASRCAVRGSWCAVKEVPLFTTHCALRTEYHGPFHE